METRQRFEQALRDRYELREEIGRGGMAVVFRAHDARHGRDVAIKVLQPEVAAAIGPDRFLREIELAAGLTHANILPVFDSGEADDFLYFVMPCVEGETLRERLERDGRLPVDEAIGIAREVADGLDYAHRRGIVHRDVKPGNILLSDGHAYVMDFGIARAVGPEAEDRLTRTGLAIGTPAYMSPEQAAGEPSVDAPTDVYALGCVLYEMLSGDLPFEGDTPQAVLVKRLTDEPEPIRARRRDVPSDVERALARALSRDPKSRFPTAGGFRDALAPAARRITGWSPASVGRRLAHRARRSLRPHPVLVPIVAMVAMAALAAGAWWMFGTRSIPAGGTSGDGATSGPGPVRLAVLPVEPVAGDVEAYAGLLEAGLTRQLSAIDGLAVPSRRAVASLTQAGVSADSVAKALDVSYVIESTLAGFGDSLRLDLDLVDATAGWTIVRPIREEVPRADVVELADTVVRRVAVELRAVLGREFRPRELRSQTDDSEAALLVHEAETLREAAVDSAAAGGEARDRALALLARSDSLLAAAEDRDPAWGEIHVQRGLNAIERALAKGDEPRVFGPEDRAQLERALAAADRGLTSEPESADAIALRGRALHGLAGLAEDPARRDSLDAAAAQELERAIEADPRNVEALRELARHRQLHQGAPGDAHALLKRAYEADRWHRDAPQILFGMAETATDLGWYDSARVITREGSRRWPENSDFPALELMALASDGTDVARAWALADTVLDLYATDRLDPAWAVLQSFVAPVIARAGLPDSARRVLARAERMAAETGLDTFASYNFAHARLVLGDTTQALDWLAMNLADEPEKRAYRAQEAWFRPLHGNPRFEALVAPPEREGEARDGSEGGETFASPP